MTAPKTPAAKCSISTLAAILGMTIALTGAGVAVVRYLAPLGELPQEVKALSCDINQIGRVQAVQTEALKTLAEVAADTKSMRRDVDEHTTQIEVVKQRLAHIEGAKQP